MTEAGNVWSLAVLLWEIAEFGKMPYAELSDEEVIYQVLSTDGKTRLPQPNCPFGQYMYDHFLFSILYLYFVVLFLLFM